MLVPRALLHSASILLALAATATAQTTWTGGVSTNWDHAGNWDTASVPTGGTNVIIASAANMPASYIFNPNCNDLTIGAGASVDLGGGFDLSVAGDLNIEATGTLTVSSATSDVSVAGDWMNLGTFTSGGGTVRMTGTGDLQAGGDEFQNLIVSGSTCVAISPFSALGDVSIEGSATLDIGNMTHTVAGTWTSSSPSVSVIGTGTIEFNGTGLVTTGSNALPNMSVSLGTRSVNPTTVSGNLSMTDGAIQVLDNVTFTVGGDANLIGGTLGFTSSFAGLEVLDVGGNVAMGAAAGSMGSTVRIRCAGNWSSSSAFSPGAGSVEMDGPGANTIDGLAPTFFDLTIADGTKTLLATGVVAGDLIMLDGAALSSPTATLDVNGAVVMGDGSSSWAIGSGTHTVAGNWVSLGGNATGTGLIDFDGTGTLSTGAGAISNVRVASGTRTVLDSNISTDLALTGGALEIQDDQTLTVDGSVAMIGGTFSMISGGAATAVETLDVEGDLTLAATPGSFSDNSRILCDGALVVSTPFSMTQGLVTVGGASNTIGGSSLALPDLTVAANTRTVTAAMTLAGELIVSNGATLDSDAGSVIAGAVTLGDGTSGWDTGTFNHSIGGDYTTAGANATGSGTLEFNGTGLTATLSSTMPNVTVSAGTRSFFSSEVTGDLAMTDGEIVVLNNAVLDVAGNASLTGGMLSFETGTPGTQILDVAGDMTLTAAAGSATAGSIIACGGNWSSDSTFAPLNGQTVLDSTIPTTISGTAPTFYSLRLFSNTHTLQNDAFVGGNLQIDPGATLDTDAVLDIAGNVTLDDNTSAWDLGAFTHTVAGDWSSVGGSATGAGTIEFDGTGLLSTSTGSIARVLISAGDRTGADGTIDDTLDMTGGSLTIGSNQTLIVSGDANLSGGILGWALTEGSEEVLIVGGNLDLTAAAGDTTAGSILRVAGDYRSNSNFAPTDGAVELAGAANLSGLAPGFDPLFADLTLLNSTRTVTDAIVVSGTLDVATGATLDADAVIDVDGSVTLGAASVWDLGGLTHTIAGAYDSDGGDATGGGTIELNGDGLVRTNAGSVPNLVSSAGNRSVFDTNVTGNVTVTGGEFLIRDGATLAVAGNADFSGGSLSWNPTPNGSLDLIDVEGDVSITCPNGTASADAFITCAGNWVSDAIFAPAVGKVLLDGALPSTIDGAGIDLAQLLINNSTRTLLSAATLDRLQLDVGSGFISNAAVDVDDVILADGSSWDLGGQTHTVGGDWTSSGATGGSSTGAGLVQFDGPGNLSTGNGTIASAEIVAGTRDVFDSHLTGNLSMTGGELLMRNDQTLVVDGNLDLTGGELSWVGSTSGANEIIDVDGDASVLVSIGSEGANSRLQVAGNWTSDANFQPVLARVVLDGGTNTTVTAPAPDGATEVFFADLEVESGTKTVLNEAAAVGEILVNAGGTLVLGADISAASVEVDGGTLDLGGQTIAVSGNWTSDAVGAVVSGPGLIEFNGLGTTSTGTNTIPDVLLSAGVRGFVTSSIAGNLDSTGAQLAIGDNAMLAVSGDVTLTGGILSFSDASAGVELLDVEGNLDVDATAGTTNANTRIELAGNWTSTAAFSPSAGLLVMDGTGPSTIGGTGTTLANLEITTASGTTLQAPLVMQDLEIVDGASLLADDIMALSGGMTLAATAALDLGGLTHFVGGDYVSVGGNATNGKLNFSGNGLLDTGTATIDQVQVSLGNRDAATSAIAGSLELTGGTLTILDDQTLSVAGNADLTGGTLSWDTLGGGDLEILDVEGNCTLTASAGTTTDDSFLRCAGDYTGNDGFSPSGGVVELDGAGTQQLGGVIPGETLAFGTLRLSGGTVQTGAAKIEADQVEVQSTATLQVPGVITTLLGPLVTVDGTLQIDPAGTLAADADTAILITKAGTVRMIGTTSDESRVAGDAAGGGYLFNILGTIEATHYRFEGMDASGIAIALTATIAPFPNDMRSGTFARPSPTPGSVLLDIDRLDVTELRQVDFRDPLGEGTYNVTTGGPKVITFVNSDGNFAGETFEKDPFDLIDWNTDATILLDFTAVPGPGMVDLEWISSNEADIDMYIVQRGLSFGGPFDDLGEIAPLGGGNTYNFTDLTVSPGPEYVYNIAQRLTNNDVEILLQTTATPWPTGFPSNFLTVGPSAQYTTIQGAIDNIGSTQLPVIRVEAGTYAAFDIGPGALGTLRVIGEGPGVVIDTTLAPVTIHDLGSSESVELSDLTIGDGITGGVGVAVTDCDGVVILDDLVVHGGLLAAGVSVGNSSKVAIQRSDMDGTPGLLVELASTVIASKGALDDLEVKDTSKVRLTEMPTSSTVDPGATLTEYAGVMADIDVPELIDMSEGFTMTLSGAPNGIWTLIFSVNLAWQDFTGSKWEMVGLADLGVGVLLLNGPLGGSGVLPLPAAIPPDGTLHGLPLVLQTLVVAPGGQRRWSNVATIIAEG